MPSPRSLHVGVPGILNNKLHYFKNISWFHLKESGGCVFWRGLTFSCGQWKLYENKSLGPPCFWLRRLFENAISRYIKYSSVGASLVSVLFNVRNGLLLTSDTDGLSSANFDRFHCELRSQRSRATRVNRWARLFLLYVPVVYLITYISWPSSKDIQGVPKKPKTIEITYC